jgi:hypothetical protein
MTDEATTDEAATLLTVQSAFEAHTIVAVLKSAGIPARAFDAEDAGFGPSFRPATRGVPVQVPVADLQRAREVVEAGVSESVDIDWDAVDLGTREDNLPLREPGRMPILARIAFYLALLLVLVAVIAGVIALL